MFTSCNNINEYNDGINVNDKDLKIEGINILNKTELKRIYDNSKAYEIKVEIKTNKGNSNNLNKFIDANLVNVYTTNSEVASISQNKINFIHEGNTKLIVESSFDSTIYDYIDINYSTLTTDLYFLKDLNYNNEETIKNDIGINVNIRIAGNLSKDIYYEFNENNNEIEKTYFYLDDGDYSLLFNIEGQLDSSYLDKHVLLSGYYDSSLNFNITDINLYESDDLKEETILGENDLISSSKNNIYKKFKIEGYFNYLSKESDDNYFLNLTSYLNQKTLLLNTILKI